MKKLLVLLFSLFLLSSPSVFADDISDFQIGGISIGDSLLDYMSEDEILEEIELRKDYYHYFNEPNKYAEVYLFKDFSTYDFVSVMVKNNSTNVFLTDKKEKYTILSVFGTIRYIEDFDGCKQKRDEIVEILSKMFPNVDKSESFFKHAIDPSGNSTVDRIRFEFSSGETIDTRCTNFEETLRIKNNWTEGLEVAVRPLEILTWLGDHK
jgi:hypothetical protein